MPSSIRFIPYCLAAALLPSFATAQESLEESSDPVDRQSDSALFEPVVDRSRGFSDRERTLLYRLLAESNSPSHAEQQRAARELVGGRRKQMPEFDDRSDSEFLIEDLLRTTRLYRGRPIELRGYARGLEKQQAGANEFGVSAYYKLRLYVAEGDNSPVEVYFLSLPKNWPAGRNFVDDVSVVGRFFKLIEYDDRQTGGTAYAPVVVSAGIEHRPKIEEGDVRLDPALWEGTVRHRKRGWTSGERDLYYRILQHARDGDYRLQKKRAANNLRGRIERYRDDAESEHARMKQQAEQYRQSHPDQEAEYERRLEDADRQYRRRLNVYRKLRDKPRLFPAFADLIKHDDTPFRTQLITLKGRVRHLTKSPVDEQVRYKLGTLYEVWFYTDDSQQHPAVAITTSVPEGLLRKAREEGDGLNEPVSVTGYFFRLHVYKRNEQDLQQSRERQAAGSAEPEKEFRVAPMLLAQRVEWQPSPADRTFASDLYVLPVIAMLIVGMAIGMTYFFWKAKREDREFQRQRAAGRDETAVPDFDQIGGELRSLEPTFENVETSPEQDFRGDDPIENST